jgi:predicted TIM-barrel fold metal-dependent hydrolase
MNRRRFWQGCAWAGAAWSAGEGIRAGEPEEIIDLHQHVNYHGRLTADLLAHQDAMGMAKTVLLPSGTELARPSTHQGKSNGLAARVHGPEAAARLAEAHPGKFVWFANEVPDLDGAVPALERWLRRGACGIGEQKFGVDCDGPEMRRIYDLARDHGVPVLIHFQHGTYNHGFERFHRILAAYPTVTFFGHAQTFWGHIDAKHEPAVLYPKGPVAPGGLTDRYLADYPNLYGDLSAGSALNAMTRDPGHAAAFLNRHAGKLCYASDCADREGSGPGCSGAQMRDVIRTHVTDPAARANIFSANAKRLIRGLA